MPNENSDRMRTIRYSVAEICSTIAFCFGLWLCAGSPGCN